MALVKSGTLGSGTPLLAYELYAEQTSGSGTKRTIKMTLKAKVNGTSSASFYGYPADYYFTVNGTKTTTTALKSSTRWYGNEAYRSFTATVTVDVGTTSSKAITVGVTVSSTSIWNGTASGSFTVGSTNTAPVVPSSNAIVLKENNSSGRTLGTTTNGTENGVKFGENVNALYLSWNKATDNEGNTLTYEIYEQVDNGSFISIGTTTSNYYTRTIGSGSSTQGKMYDYYIKVKDSGGLYASGQYDATQVQKNILTGASGSCLGTIGYNTESFEIKVSGASNTIGDTNFTYYIYSNDIKIYNQVWTADIPQTVKIWKTGEAVPTTQYIKFDDLKALLADSNYQKSITFYVQTKNAYGSIVTKSFPIDFNIQSNPTAFTFGSIDGYSTVNGNSYLIPSQKAFTITWGVPIDNLGNGIVYDVYYSYNNGSNYTLIASNLTDNIYTGSFPSVTKETSVKFKIVAKTSYGTTNSAISNTYIFHHVGVPSVKLSLVRNQSNYTITGTVTVNTSIPNIGISSVKYTSNSVSTQTSITPSGNTFTLTKSLAEGDADTVRFYVLDKANADLGKSAVTVSQVVGRYNPMFSIREKGVGVNCVNDGNDGVFKVNGHSKVTGVMSASQLKAQGIGGTVAISTDWLGAYIHDEYNDKYLELNYDGNLYYDDKKVFHEGQVGKSGAWFNSPVIVNSSGSSDVGRTLNFHYLNSYTNAYDGRITLTGSNAFQFSGSIATSGITNTGNVSVSGSGYTNCVVSITNTESGIQGSLWSGTGGFVCQAEEGANLHLGANNSTTDLILESTGNAKFSVPITSTKSITGSGFFIQSNGVFESTTGTVTVRSRADSYVYLQGSQIRAVQSLTTGTWRPMYASAFTVGSTVKSKMKIQTVSDDDRIDTMQLLKNTNVYTYHLIDEVERGYYHNKKIGFLAEATPAVLKAEDEQAIDLYSMASTIWDVCKQQQEQIEKQQKEIEELTEVVALLCE